MKCFPKYLLIKVNETLFSKKQLNLKCYFIPWDRNWLIQARVKATLTLPRFFSPLMLFITLEMTCLRPICSTRLKPHHGEDYTIWKHILSSASGTQWVLNGWLLSLTEQNIKHLTEFLPLTWWLRDLPLQYQSLVFMLIKESPCWISPQAPHTVEM